jgi:glycerol-3-phosphate acyltransferase PlsY
VTERLLCLCIGYICGLFQTGYIVGKIKGIDIREHGSGNAGTTNILRTMGIKYAVIVLLGDALKCGIAILITRKLFVNDENAYLQSLLALYASVGVILGHNFPFYMGFKGGKGIACTGGLVFSSDWRFIVMGLAAFFIPFFTVHMVSVGSLLVYFIYVVMLIFLGQTGFFAPMAQANLTEMYILAFFLMAMAYWRHRTNIVNLINGTERKTYLFKKPEGHQNPDHSGK